MKASTKDSNKAHEESLAVVAEFIKQGGKVEVIPLGQRDYIKGTINKHTGAKDA